MIARSGRLGRRWALPALLLLLCAAMFVGAQEQKPKPAENVPDAPSVNRNPQSFPPATAPGTNTAPPRAADEPPPASSSKAPSLPPETKPQQPAYMSEEAPATPPPPSVTMAQPRAGSAPGENSRDDFTIVSRVNFVVVPVTVKDSNGRLVDGLLKRDFSILEDGVAQSIQLFTSDPFPLSAAVVVDTGISDVELRKVQNTLPVLAGAFSAFDEVSVYTYGSSVDRVSDFAAVSNRLDDAIRKVRATHGDRGGVAFAGGPFNTKTPVINGKNVDPNADIVPVVRPQSRVLNDAILAAANDLAKRERTRRRILFVISDGRELGSRASYQDVLKVLLSNEISVYSLAIGGTAMPVYGTLQKVRIPGQGYGDILPKYASATGGDMIREFGAKGIEAAYAQVTAQARNEYTLGYTTRATAASNYREIEVLVRRPNLTVHAKTGYYPLPPVRNAPAENVADTPKPEVPKE